MNSIEEILKNFILQAESGDLTRSRYPSEYSQMNLKISFGMGMPARVPWIAFLEGDMVVSNGYYPVYLYYKDMNKLVLAYGVSETTEYEGTWPLEVIQDTSTIKSHFNIDVPRYGNSYVYKVYEVSIVDNSVQLRYEDSLKKASQVSLESDLDFIIELYLKSLDIDRSDVSEKIGQGKFYMETQLEDFIIHNWEQTDLGRKYDLVYEDNEMVSQQYKTEIGPIDILAKDKETGDFIVVELKKDQTSDDTVGQIARYMGWINEKNPRQKVKGIIIAGKYDKKLDYVLRMISNVDVYLYKVNFELDEFK